MDKKRFVAAGFILLGFLFLLLTAFPSTAVAGDMCWKHTKGRGVGTIPSACGEGKVLQGAYCFDKCPNTETQKYDDGDFLCWERCPADPKFSKFRNDPMHCAKPAVPWIDHAGFPWTFDDPPDLSGAKRRCEASAIGKQRGGCEQLGLIYYPKCAADRTRIALACSPKCPGGWKDIGVSCEKPNVDRSATRDVTGCEEGKENDAGLCYPKCETVPGLNRGYDGVGPVCWQKCPISHPVACGMGCATNEAACARGVTDQVFSVVKLAVTVASTLVAPGVASNVLEVVERGTEGAQTLVEIAIEGADSGPGAAAVRSVEGAFDEAFGNLTADVDNTAIETALGGLWASSMETGQGFIEGENAEEQISKLADGIANTARGIDFDLGLLANFDPTGIVEVINSFKKPVCAHSESDIDIAAEEKVARNAWSMQQEWDSSTGSVWIVGPIPDGVDELLKWSHDKFESNNSRHPIKPLNVAVDGLGRPWFADEQGRVFRCSKEGIGCIDQNRGGPKARDIAVSVDGQAWITGLDDGIYYRHREWDDKNGTWVDKDWKKLKGTGHKISVDAQGNPWVTRIVEENKPEWIQPRKVSQIWRLEKGIGEGGEIVIKAWTQLPGYASDIGVGGNGQVWKTDGQFIPTDAWLSKDAFDEVIGDQNIYFWDAESREWIWVPGRGGVRIDVDSAGQPWIVDSRGEISFLQGGAKPVRPWVKDDQGNIHYAAKGTRVTDDKSLALDTSYAFAISHTTVPCGVTTRDSDTEIQCGSPTPKKDCERSEIGVARGGCGTLDSLGTVYYPKAKKYSAGTWRRMPGQATDIAIGWPSDGTTTKPQVAQATPKATAGFLKNKEAWMVTTGTRKINRWDGGKWAEVKGDATLIEVGPKGEVWVTDSRKNVYRRAGSEWKPASNGVARDISIGSDGTVWSIGEKMDEGGGRIYSWDGAGWRVMDTGAAVKIAAARRQGSNPWVVNNKGHIFYLLGNRMGGTWHGRSKDKKNNVKTASDIAVLDDFGSSSQDSDEVWIIDGKPGQPGQNIWVLHYGEWKEIKGDLGQPVSINADLDGGVWVVNKQGEIFVRQGGANREGIWLKAKEGSARAIGVGRPYVKPVPKVAEQQKRIWLVGDQPNNQPGQQNGLWGNEVFYKDRVWDASSRDWRDDGAWKKLQVSAVRIAVDPKGRLWIVQKNDDLWRLRDQEKEGWDKMPVKAKDVAIGANGHIWIVYPSEKGSGGFGMRQLHEKGGLMADMDKLSKKASAMKIAVDPNNNVWSVNKLGKIYYSNPHHNVTNLFLWHQAGQSARALDIGVEHDDTHWGKVWMLGTDHKLYIWNRKTNLWEFVKDAAGDAIASGPDGPWVVKKSGEVRELKGGQYGKWRSDTTAPKATAIAIGAPGKFQLKVVCAPDPTRKTWHVMNESVYKWEGDHLVLAPGMKPSDVPAEPKGPALDPNAYYRITSKAFGDGKSLDIVNDGQNNKLIMADTANVSGQFWKFTRDKDGLYKLTTQWRGPDQPLRMITTGEGPEVILHKAGHFDWIVSDTGDGYRIQKRPYSKEPSNCKGLDAVNAGMIAPAVDVKSQLWKLTKIGAPATKPAAAPTTSYGRGVGFPWKFGDLNLTNARKRCEASASGKQAGGCEQVGPIWYPKCKPGYKPIGCCVCQASAQPTKPAAPQPTAPATKPAAQPSALPTDGWKWVVGNKPNLAQQNGRFGNEIYYKDGAGNWVKIGASAVRIAVAPDGSPYIVQKNNDIWRLEMGGAGNVEKRWIKLPGQANDIGVGANGQAWHLAVDNVPGGHGIYGWHNGGWRKIDGAAVRIAVAPDGNPWVVNSSGNIYRREGGFTGKWVGVSGKAKDIGVGANGSVWVIGAGALTGGYGIYVWQNNAWKQVDGAAVNISVASDGNPWVVNSNGDVFRREGGVNGKWVHMPGAKAADIGAQ